MYICISLYSKKVYGWKKLCRLVVLDWFCNFIIIRNIYFKVMMWNIYIYIEVNNYDNNNIIVNIMKNRIRVIVEVIRF